MYLILLIASLVALVLVLKDAEGDKHCSACDGYLSHRNYFCSKCSAMSLNNFLHGMGGEFLTCLLASSFCFSLFKLIIEIDNILTKLIGLVSMLGSIILACLCLKTAFDIVMEIKYKYLDSSDESSENIFEDDYETEDDSVDDEEEDDVIEDEPEEEEVFDEEPEPAYFETETIYDDAPDEDPMITFALIMSAAKGELSKVKELISKDVSPDVKESSEGIRPIMAALKYGHVDVANYLIEQGANLKVVDNFGQDLRQYAQTGMQEIILNPKTSDKNQEFQDFTKIIEKIERAYSM